MPDYKIVEVRTKKDLKKFIQFPDDLYKDCEQYVPALHSDQKFCLTKVSTLSYCSRKMWLVFDGKKVVGRICGMINPHYNERYHTKRARFGWFDTINDLEVAKLLLDTAEAWAKENGMNEIHGPLFYNTLGKQGMVVEGFENLPPFNCLYNYAYYNDLVTALGYEKEIDWIQYKLRADQGVAPKLRRVCGMLTEKYDLHEGKLDLLKKDAAMVKEFFHIYNASFSESVYNFIPFTEEEMEEEAKSTMPYVNDKVSAVVMDKDENLVAFGISFPSISKALQKCKGHMFPFGWIHLLRAMHDYSNVDMMLNGAVPKWQNTGVSSIFHCLIADKFRANGCKWAITNPQIETNGAVNIWSRYEDCELYIRRRCYIKSI